MLSNETVVVFGGAGYIGCPLVEMLLEENYNVKVFDNFCFGDEGIKSIEHPNLSIIDASICDCQAVSASIKGADAVILLAATVGHRIREVPAATMRTVNFLASTVVLDASIEHGVPRFIFASTNSVYGSDPGLFYETTIPSPVSLYSRLKLRMEERIISEKKKGVFHPTALRLGTCHGYSNRMRFDLVVNSLVREAVIHGKIQVTSGEQMRAFIQVRDAARAFLACLKAHENLISGEVFNVAAPEQNLQINQVVNAIKSLLPEIEVEILPGEPDLTSFRLSCKKIEKLLDFKCTWTLENSIREVIDSIQSGKYKDPYSLKYQNS
jgi:nucleoside-diphosphate-sugar epimerase